MDRLLQEFAQYLRQRLLLPESGVGAYVGWVRSFLPFAGPIKHLGFDACLDRFLAELARTRGRPEWQIGQAKDALHVYYYQFRNGGEANSAEADDGGPNVGALLEELRTVIRRRRYAYSTEKGYTKKVRAFLAYRARVGLADRPIVAEDVKNYLTHVAMHKGVAKSTQNGTFFALVFFFENVLHQSLEGLGKSVRAKRGRKLPVVVWPEEAEQLLSQLSDDDWLWTAMLYGTGLRVSELARLRVKDLDFAGECVCVRSGKGDKDRYTLLPTCLFEPLRQHLTHVQAVHKEDLALGLGEVYMPDALGRKYPNAGREWGWQYVFPASRLAVDPRSGISRRHHIAPKLIQRAVKEAARRAGLVKHVTPHTLRHGFATSLLINGADIREVQEFLGHKSLETTMIYTHVIRQRKGSVASPLDVIGAPSAARPASVDPIANFRHSPARVPAADSVAEPERGGEAADSDNRSTGEAEPARDVPAVAVRLADVGALPEPVHASPSTAEDGHSPEASTGGASPDSKQKRRSHRARKQRRGRRGQACRQQRGRPRGRRARASPT